MQNKINALINQTDNPVTLEILYKVLNHLYNDRPMAAKKEITRLPKEVRDKL